MTTNTTAGTFAERLAEAVFTTMWKPWNALLDTPFRIVGYIGFLAVWSIGITLASVFYLISKLAGK